MTEQVTAGPAFDRARLADIAKGGPVTADAFLAEFRRSTELDTASLFKAANAGEPAQAMQLAHRIEGACRMIGAAELAGACSRVAAAASMGSASDLRMALGEFTDTRERLHAFIDASVMHASVMRVSVIDAPVMHAPDADSASRREDKLCSGLSFLVVEDHEFQRGVIIRMLQRLGAAQVQGFASGAEALQAARSLSQPGAILMLDLGMPTLNGIDIARIAGVERLAVSIILHSAQPEQVLLSQAEAARSGPGVVLGAIGKPLTAAKLAPLIASHRSLIAGTATGPPGSP